MKVAAKDQADAKLVETKASKLQAEADLAQARRLCSDLLSLSQRLREGADAPMARVLSALIEHADLGQ